MKDSSLHVGSRRSADSEFQVIGPATAKDRRPSELVFCLVQHSFYCVQMFCLVCSIVLHGFHVWCLYYLFFSNRTPSVTDSSSNIKVITYLLTYFFMTCQEFLLNKVHFRRTINAPTLSVTTKGLYVLLF